MAVFDCGQNIAKADYQMSWNATVQLWYNEVEHFKFDQNPTGVVGDFTQLVWAKSWQVHNDDYFQKNIIFLHLTGQNSEWKPVLHYRSAVATSFAHHPNFTFTSAITARRKCNTVSFIHIFYMTYIVCLDDRAENWFFSAWWKRKLHRGKSVV